MKEKYYFTYVLRSEKDSKLYVGWTNNMEKRFEMHAKGLVKATKNRRPFRLVYYEACLHRRNAIKREKILKTGFGRKYILERIYSSS